MPVNELLSKYGNTLQDIRKLLPQLPEAIEEEKKRIRQRQPITPTFYTVEEARELGISLEPGWSLKVWPARDGGQPDVRFITPDKWEITEDDRYISPEGKSYTRQELEAKQTFEEQEAIPEIETPVVSQPRIKDFSYAEQAEELDIDRLGDIWAAVFPGEKGFDTLTELEEASSRLQLIQSQLTEAMPPTEKMSFEMERAGLERQLEDFWLRFRIAGRTPESERLLSMIGATPEDIELIYAPAISEEIPSTGLPIPMQSDTGEMLDTKVMPDSSVWLEGAKIGHTDLQTGEFTPLGQPEWMSEKEAKAWYDERLRQIEDEYKDIADWTVPGWQKRREENPGRVDEWFEAKTEAWREYQLYNSEPGVAVKALQSAAMWFYKTVEIPWNALTLEVKARDAVIRGDATELEEEIIRKVDNVRERYGWTAIFSSDILVEEGMADLYEARKEEGYKGVIPLSAWEWMNPVYMLPIGGTLGFAAKFTTKVPVIGKSLRAIAGGVQAVERGIAEAAVTTVKAPVWFTGKVFGDVGRRIGDRGVAKLLRESKHITTLEDLASMSTDDILDFALADNWMKRALAKMASVPPIRFGIERGLGWRVLTNRQGKAVEEVIARGAVVHAEIIRRGINAKSIKYWELFHIEPNPTKYFGFDKGAYSPKMAKKLLPEFKAEPNGGTLEHVFTKPEMYNWRGMDRGLEYVTKVHEMNTEILRWLTAEGVPPEHLIDDWIHRVVNVEKMPHRGAGVRRVGARPGYEKVRKYETMADGLAAGVPYEADINVSIAEYIDQAFKKVADKRFMNYVGELGVKPAERLAERFPEVVERAALTQVELADAAKFQSVVNRAIRGERLPEVTLTAIEKRFPSMGRRLRALVTSDPVETEVREVLSQHKKVISELRARVEKAEAIDVKKIYQEAYEKARVAIPDDEKLREAFRLMESDERLAFRQTMAMQLDEIVRTGSDFEAQIAGLREAIATDPVANYRVNIGMKPVGKGAKARVVQDYRGLEFFISIREQEFPKYFTVKQARQLMGTEPTVIAKNGKVAREVALDSISKELNMSTDDIAERVMQIRAERANIRQFEEMSAWVNNRSKGIERMIRVMDDVDASPRITIVEETPVEATPLPKAEAGMPEAGLQKDIFGYEHRVFPKGKGEVTQISMDDALKLDKIYKDAGIIPPDMAVKPKVQGIPELSAETTVKRLNFELPAPKAATQRIADLKSLRKEVKALTESRKVPYWQARAEKAYRMEQVRQPDIGEGFIMQPFAGGKIFQQDFIDSFNKFFGHSAGLPGFNITSDVAGILRITKAALDFSAMCIQGLPSWGLAHSYLLQNPKVGLKLMGAWYRAFGESVAAFFVPDVLAGYVTKNKSTAMNRILFGGSARAVDYFAALEARVGIGGWAERMMGRIPLRPYHRAEVAFFGAGEIVRDEFWKILGPRATVKGQEYELARFLDRITGLFDSGSIGVPVTVRQLEQTFMWFAPNYTRSCLTVLADVFRGGMTGAETRKALGGMISAGAAMYSGVQYGLATLEGKSHDEAWQTVHEGFGVSQDPITGEWTWKPSAQFMTIKVGNYNFGLGGFWYGLLRLSGNIMACINEVGEREVIDLVRIMKNGSFNKDNPFIYWWYTRSSPLVGTGVELWSGQDFLGYPIETPAEYAKYIATRFEPIWMEQGINWMIPGMARENEVPEGAARAAMIPAEVFGMRTFPESSWVKFYDKSKEVIGHLPEDELDPKQVEPWSNGELEWNNLTSIQKTDLLNRYPELEEIYTEAQADSALRGSNVWKQWESRSEEEKGAYYSRGNNLLKRVQSGEIDTRELREMWSEAGQNYGTALDAIEKEPSYEAIYNYFDRKESKGEKYGFLDDLALSEYTDIMFTDYLDSKGDYDWNAKDRAVDAFVEKWGEDTYQRIRQMYSDKKGMEGLEPALIRLSEDKDKLGRGYWRLPYKPISEMDEDDFAEGNIPDEYHGLWEQYQALGDNEQEEYLIAHPELSKDWRAEYRRNNPEEDARLALWGYGGKIQSMEAYDTVLKWSRELNIPLAQMGLGLPPPSLAEDYFGYNALDDYYEQKWYRQEHPEFESWGQETYGWKPIEDQSIISREVQQLYKKYSELEIGKARLIYRHENPELEEYLVENKGYTPVGDRWK